MRTRPSSVTSAARPPSGLSAMDRAAPTSKLAQRAKRPTTSAPGGGNMNADGSGRHENGKRVAEGSGNERGTGAGPTWSIGGQTGTDAPTPGPAPPASP